MALPLALGWDASGLDLPLSRLFAAADGFAWRHAWLTERVLHDGVRWLAALILIALIWDLVKPIWLGPSRREKGFWLGLLVAAWLLVPAFKRKSLTSCPWELAEFGGNASYVPHWIVGVADGGPGHCFPSGHATTAFGFFALAMLWLPHNPPLARRIGIASFLCGAVLAMAQLVRGAHYLSHSLWTAWFCGALVMLASLVAPGGQPRTRIE